MRTSMGLPPNPVSPLTGRSIQALIHQPARTVPSRLRRRQQQQPLQPRLPCHPDQPQRVPPQRELGQRRGRGRRFEGLQQSQLIPIQVKGSQVGIEQ